ncbi:lectin, galactoside-binding, soluble, 2b [Triplophysa dalaica]|uniref:lectin, galactoside-binding, soluble, 2b n=1 Tax=Triplophysa dalaica TaxID=1582913 RepID=UPI0024DF8DC7|nr:lectin, galactoside-binding, soluble, 2b [Triplophysa dalaica]
MVFTVKDMSFNAGTELKISGKVKSDCEGFSINVGHDCDNIALHFNPRFTQSGDSRVIICNSNLGGWGDEHREPCFPFEQGQEFKLSITFNNETFYIKLPDGNMMSFANRLGDDSFSHIHVHGDVKVHSVKVK